jgi:hypothetical protein
LSSFSSAPAHAAPTCSDRSTADTAPAPLAGLRRVSCARRPSCELSRRARPTRVHVAK